QEQRGVSNRFDLLQSGRCRQRKFHDETTRPQIAPEMLAEHTFDVRFVIDHDNIRAQDALPSSLVFAAVARGSVITNCVNAPGSLVTSIVPPCCFTMMS